MYSSFDDAVEAYRKTLDAFIQGDPEPSLQLWSHRDDVSLANPIGPPVIGWKAVKATATYAASLLSDGVRQGYDEVSRVVTEDMGYLVQIERMTGRLAGVEGLNDFALRVTMILRREDDGWKVVHRHADPIVTSRPVESVLRS